MYANVTLNITTNSSDSANGAMVTFTNHDNNPEHYYTETVTGSSANFPAVWKGDYQISIRLAGFEIHNDNVEIVNDIENHSAQLIELFIPPTD